MRNIEKRYLELNKEITLNGTSKEIIEEMESMAIENIDLMLELIDKTAKIESDIKAAKEIVSEYVDITEMKEIVIENINDSKCDGYFLGKNTNIRINVNIKSDILRTIIHEIGHYVHESKFENKRIKLSAKNRSKYSKTNNFENFAEAFTDMFMRINENFNYERDNQMKALLGI